MQLCGRPPRQCLLHGSSCAPYVAPPRYPTRVTKKRHASGLLGLRGVIGVSVGERRWLPNSVRSPWPCPLPLLYRRPLISPELEAQLENPKPCLIWVQPELGFYPLKRATLQRPLARCDNSYTHVKIISNETLVRVS
jgi:hypothetical protein